VDNRRDDVEEYGDYYATSDPCDMARELLDQRQCRNLLTWRVLNRTYNDHLIKPTTMPKVVWAPLSKRFTVTDLASPVLSTINSATYGSRVTRTIHRAYNKEAIEKFMAEAKYEAFVPLLHRDAAGYGTSFGSIGRKTVGRGKKASLVRLHPINTRIATSKTDIDDVRAVITRLNGFDRMYAEDGIVDKGPAGVKKTLANSNYGFVPVAIGRGRWMDACTPYGESLIWPAIEETKQVTALMCDLMVLERNQSYSTLVITGELASNPQEGVASPWVVLRGVDEDFDAKYISPSAKIKEINDIIESKFERCATQCQVPVELFVRAKSGTMQAAGAADLQHKPLYDLVIEQQKSWREVEMDLVARIDAFIEFERTNKPQEIERFRENLHMEIEFENETNPSFNQSQVQTIIQAMDAGLLDRETAFRMINRNKDWEEKFRKANQELAERESAALELEWAGTKATGGNGDA